MKNRIFTPLLALSLTLLFSCEKEEFKNETVNPMESSFFATKGGTGTSLQPIFSKLTGSVTFAAALESSLIGTGSGSPATAIKINELFTSYGY